MQRYGHAVLGGTFDHLHVGHVALLDRAFQVGTRVSIGLTTDRYLRQHPKPFGRALQSYANRRRALRRWLLGHYPHRSWRIARLEDRFGRSVEDGVDVLVVSADTREGGRAVNDERRRRGHRTVPIAVVPVVLADDLGPVSSRRVRSGDINRWGRRRAPISVGVGLDSPEDGPAVERAIRRAFPTSRLSRPGLSGPPRRQLSDDARASARARAAVEGHDLGLGVARSREGGWSIVERSPTVELAPTVVAGGSARALERAMLATLRPDLGRKAFAPRSASRRRWRRTSG